MGAGGLSLPVRYGGDGRRRYRSMASPHPVLPLPSVPPPPPPSPNAPVSSSAFISYPVDLFLLCFALVQQHSRLDITINPTPLPLPPSPPLTPPHCPLAAVHGTQPSATELSLILHCWTNEPGVVQQCLFGGCSPQQSLQQPQQPFASSHSCITPQSQQLLHGDRTDRSPLLSFSEVTNTLLNHGIGNRPSHWTIWTSQPV